MPNTDIKPAAVAVGVVVVAGVILYSMKKKRSCTELPGIWSKDGPLHLTREAQDEAMELARYKIREYMLTSGEYTLSDVQMYVADSLRDCAWEKLKTDEQKQVWAGVKHIVNEVNQRAKQDPDGFLQSFAE